MSEELAYLSAREAIDRFASRRLSPVEWMQALLARAERLAPAYRATVAIHAEQALAAARVAEERYRAGTARPLEGVPVAIKEETSVAGWRRTIGSWLHDEVPAAHHPIVDRLVRAGAIPHLQTAVPEFCVIPQTHSLRFGVTRNPWNPALTPGGSSGGSGAALAAGLAPLATGSDMGGSTRIPAALAGVYGYKPPFGRLASTPGEELFAFAVEGPLARTFDDLVLMQNAIVGPHPASYTGLPAERLPSRYPDLDGALLGLVIPGAGRALCRDTRRGLEAAAEALRARGARLETIELDWDPATIGDVLIEAIFGIFFDEYLEAYTAADLERATPYLRWLVGRHRGRRNSILRAAALATQLHQELDAKLWSRGARAFLCPTVLTTEVPAALDVSVTRSIEIEGRAVDSYLGWVFTQPFNLLSRYPALAVPSGRAASGVPTSVQVVGPPYGDAAVFEVAFHLAAAGLTDLFRSTFPPAPSRGTHD
jgi:Asp-tRNA(Asn)/Glu-tRNA(Gln) amidotransferase A subunit family amidase